MISLDTAACRNADPELGHPAPKDHHATDVTRAVCALCSFRLDCLVLALATPGAQGIGGWPDPNRTRRASKTPKGGRRQRGVTHTRCRGAEAFSPGMHGASLCCSRRTRDTARASGTATVLRTDARGISGAPQPTERAPTER
jgi:hypothetical protein